MPKERLIKPTVKVNPQSCRYRPAIPKGFVCVVDTQERTEIHQGYDLVGIPQIVEKLSFGDYSIKGFTDNISIERKAQGDFYGSITHGRLRFKRMLKRMQIAEFKGLVIECSEEELMSPYLSYTDVHPNSIYATLIAFEIKYGLHVYFGSRKDCENKVINWLIGYYNYKRRV